MGKLEDTKLANAQEIMRMEKIPFWIVYQAYDRDPTFTTIVGTNTAPAFLVCTSNDYRIVVASLDKDNYAHTEKLIIADKKHKTLDSVALALTQLGFNPQVNKRIAFNYTSNALSDDRADFIGYGRLTQIVHNLSKKLRTMITPISAENIIYSLYDRKTNDEIEKMSLATVWADNILSQSFAKIKKGMTERDAYSLIHQVKGSNFGGDLSLNNVVNVDYAWGKEHCPIVLTGPNLVKGGHALTSDTIIEKGHTLYADFGLKLKFSDGTSWCSDIQRMGYVLKDDETDAPPEVKRVFDTLYDAISLGIRALKPGTRGYEVDNLVRNHIKTEFGIMIPKGRFDNSYDHSTGHSIGINSHGSGAVIGIKQNKLAHLLIQPNGVYTIKPRIPIPNGGSIEEDVWVNPDGDNRTLCNRQDSLILIRT